MKIGHVAAVLPSLSAAAPRMAEGAMPFELPLVSGDSGSGAPASDDDAKDTRQSSDKVVAVEVSADIGSIIADGSVVRQMPSLPLSPIVARTQAVIAPEAPTVAPAIAMKLPDPRVGTAIPPTMIATAAPFSPDSMRVPATEASIVAQPVATPLARSVIAEVPIRPSGDTMHTASAFPPAELRQIEQGAVALPDRMAAAPVPLMSASGRPMDTLIQSKVSETPLPQPAVAGRVALSDVAQQAAGGQTPVAPVRAVRETFKATPNRAAVEQAVPAPTQTVYQIDAAPIEARIAPSRLEPVAAERLSNAARAPKPLVDTMPVAIARRMDGEVASKPPPFGPVGGGRVSWQSDLSDIDPLAAPAELAPATNSAVPSGMTRSVDAGAVPSAATLPVLDVDAGGQWLDRLALEISACAASGGMRLKLSPDNLGELSIVVSDGDSGASVVITAQDEGVRSAIAGAQDRLMAEARANGLRLADVQTGLAGESNTGTREHMRQSPQAAMPERFDQPKRTMRPEIANHERANPAGRWA